MNILNDLFSSEPFMPHGHCYFWTTSLIALHAISDAFIVLAYYSIPITLVYFVRRRKDLVFNWMFVCFAVFILACGTTHVMEIWNIWHANYWLSGSIKALTALASVPTAILLVKLIPQALALPSPSDLRRANEALQEASRVKSEFLANMSHELRTPLSSIIGFSEFLADEKPGKVNEKQKECLNDVLNSGRHLLQLINNVLDLSKVEAGKMELYPETFSIGKAIEEVCSILAPMAQKQNVVIRHELDPVVEDEVTLDQQKFKQVLYNLLSNALKFSNDGGKVDILVSPRDQTRLRLQVKDTGIGIQPEEINRLFIEFQQLDSGTTRRYEGTGLGLALTKKIVEFQKGSISVESEVGKGSTFTVELPKSLAKGGKA